MTSWPTWEYRHLKTTVILEETLSAEVDGTHTRELTTKPRWMKKGEKKRQVGTCRGALKELAFLEMGLKEVPLGRNAEYLSRVERGKDEERHRGIAQEKKVLKERMGTVGDRE